MSVDSAPTTTRRRLAAKRRAQAQPYERRATKRSSEDDRDWLEEDATDASASAAASRRPASAGIFTRLFSFLPIVGKLVTEQDNADSAADDVTPSDNEVDVSDDEDAPENDETMDNEDDASTEQEENDDAAADEPVSNGVGFTAHVPDSSVEKPRPVSATMGSGLEKTKNLIIARGEEDSFAFRRNIRRRKPATLAMDSPLSVIKQRKPISYDEYERLSTQLRGLVEPSGFAASMATKAESHVGKLGGSSSALTREREISGGDLEYPAKRPRPTEERPIALALPREDRLSRKPRPSRLLTGAKRDSASRSAYSAAVAEKILSTLNKIQTPLEQETQKPIASTSMSWAKHHLAMTKSAENDADKGISLGAATEVAPPTATIPKIAFAVSETSNDRASLNVKASSATPLFPSTTTSESMRTRTDQGVVTPKSKSSGFFTTPSVSFTPVSSSALEEESKQTLSESGGVYKFSSPIPSGPVTAMDDEDIVYCFSSPPALREPPRKAPMHKAASKNAAAAPFSLIPASPRVKPESLTKSTAPKAPAAKKSENSAPAKNTAAGANPLARFMQPQAGSWKCPSCSVTNAEEMSKCPCCETPKPSKTAKTGAEPSAPKVSEAASNPLARFMTVSPGCWKCPTCAVTNQEKDSKCPCCESAKPASGSSVAEPVTATTVKPAEAPATKAFSFGIPKSNTEEAKNVGAVESESKTPQFTFGVTSASKVTSEPIQPSSVSVSSESTNSAKPSFSFGVVSSESKESTTKPAFSFGVLASTKRKADDSSNEGSDKRQNVAASSKADVVSPAKSSEPPKPSFSFGSAPTAAEAKKPAFSFGSVSTSSSKAGEQIGASAASTTEAVKAPTFSFGSKPPSSQPQAAESQPMGAGVTVKDAVESKKPSFAFGTSSAAEPVSAAQITTSEQTTVAKPAFSFGSASASAPVSTGFSASSVAKESSEVMKPAFTFGSSSKSVASASDASKLTQSAAPDAQSSEREVAKPAFTFGSTKPESSSIAPAGVKSDGQLAAFTFGSSTKAESSSTSGPAFTFGQSGASSATSSSQPAFTFGGASSGDSAPPVAAASIAPAAPSAPAFTFGASGGSAPSSSSFSFGGQTAANPSTSQPESGAFGKTDAKSTFGSSSSFSAAPATTPSFGTTPAPTPSSFGASQPAFTFGATSQAAPSTTSFGFGATTSTASTAFGSSTDVFSSSSSSAPAFGSSATTFGAGSSGFGSAPSSGFGSNPSSTFGAPATTSFGASPGGVFGSTAPQNAFGAAPAFGSSPTPAFGSTTAASSTAPTFGSTAAPALSTPGFGAPAPSTTFGAPSFGTPSPGFGAPAPTPSPGFGAAPSGIGASPAGGFGAPAPNGFGAAGDAGAFAMGAAPAQQVPKGRRILKARTSRGAAKK